MMEQGNLAYSEGEYIHTENAGWYWFYFDAVKLGAGNSSDYFKASWGLFYGFISMYQLKQYTKKSRVFFKRF
jgi:hypothetical protein